MTEPAIKTRKSFPKVGVLVRVYYQEEEPQLQSQHGLHRETLSKKKLSELNKIHIFMIKGPIESPV